MARIPQEDMPILKSAADVKTVASTAIADMEEMSVAAMINNAANCGEYSVTCSRPISDALQAKLAGMGYELTQPAPIARPGDCWIISWK
jgi:hypothetical protein